MDIPTGSIPIGPDSGTLLIRTYRDGIGARLAHDLVLRATRWDGTLHLDGDEPTASTATVSVDPTSIEVVEATGGITGLTTRDRRTIDRNIRQDVLKTARYRDLTFASRSVDGAGPVYEVAGDMTITGRTRPVDVTVRIDGGDLIATSRIRQSDFGIRPYSSMAGTIRLRDDVEFELRLTLPTD
jgi:polyisoprenoid-binding protein YceI